MSQFTALEEELNTLSHPGAVVSTGKTSHRIKGTALAILQDYLDKHPGQVPSPRVRHALAAEVQKISGNEHFKAVNVYNWFRRRVPQVEVASSSLHDSRFPTLTADALKHLEVLSRGQLNPDAEIMNSWSSLLKASPGDIDTWLHLKRLSLNQVTHPPTPASTVTPEPSVPPTPVSPTHSSSYYYGPPDSRQATPPGVFKQDPKSPALPLISVNTETQNRIYASQHQQQQPSPVSPSFAANRLERGSASSSPCGGGGDQTRRAHNTHQHNISNSPPPSSAGATHTNGPSQRITMSRQSTPLRQASEPPSTPSSSGPPPGMPHVHYAIYKGIEKVRDMPHPPPNSSAKVPQSLTEYRTMFAPYEKKIAQIMEAVEKEKERERLEQK